MSKENFELLKPEIDPTPKEIDVWKELETMFVADEEETKAVCDEISREANEFMKFFGYWRAIRYAKARLMFGYGPEEAADYVVNGEKRSYTNYRGYYGGRE